MKNLNGARQLPKQAPWSLEPPRVGPIRVCESVVASVDTERLRRRGRPSPCHRLPDLGGIERERLRENQKNQPRALTVGRSIS